jgi:lipopolysaccharide transport system ATP-binding protein
MNVIQIENLWKEYCLGVIGHGTLTQDLQSWWAKIQGKEDPNSNIIPTNKGQRIQTNSDRLWALRNINLSINNGDVIGIIGNNGAGKSTLLKILSRVTAPTKGLIKVKGRMASLLEVGTGFHPELTGKENVHLNAAILGMSKQEVRNKYDEIVDFAGVEQYMDTPVKRYSSGMRVRLAFAVAAHLEPELLVIDEVLAVGDAEFQKKCLNRMSQVSQEGRTIVFVSHNLGAINRICSRASVICDGEIVFSGSSEDGVSFYLNSIKNANLNSCDGQGENGQIYFPEDIEKPAQIMTLTMHQKDGKTTQLFKYNEEITLLMDLVIREIKKDYYVLFFVKDMYENVIFVSSDDDLTHSQLNSIGIGKYQYKIIMPANLLKPGVYSLTVSVTQKNKIGNPIDRHDSVLSFTIVDNESFRAANDGYRKVAIVAPEIEWKLRASPVSS